jgi:hypothetical protein
MSQTPDMLGGTSTPRERMDEHGRGGASRRQHDPHAAPTHATAPVRVLELRWIDADALPDWLRLDGAAATLQPATLVRSVRTVRPLRAASPGAARVVRHDPTWPHGAVVDDATSPVVEVVEVFAIDEAFATRAHARSSFDGDEVLVLEALQVLVEAGPMLVRELLGRGPGPCAEPRIRDARQDPTPD